MDAVLNVISYCLMWLAGFVAQIFPADPFIDSINAFVGSGYVASGLSVLNWFLPFGSLVSTLGLVIACIVSLYAIKLIKWLVQLISEVLPG